MSNKVEFSRRYNSEIQLNTSTTQSPLDSKMDEKISCCVRNWVQDGVSIAHTALSALQKAKPSAQEYINKYSMQKSIEGGYFGGNCSSTNQVVNVDPAFEKTPRPAVSFIYYLLAKNDFSAWHRLIGLAESWNYYDGGSPIDIHIIDQTGVLKTYCLGNPNTTQNASFEVLVPAGCWFAAELRNKESFALAGCSVSPAFENENFNLGDRNSLIQDYPTHEAIIYRLTRVNPEITS